MGKDSTIEWTHHTFNPWWGCLKVSPACKRCYAETWAKRYRHDVWGPASTTPRREMSAEHWKQPLRWNKAAQQSGRRMRVFCASMADVFEDHPQVSPLRDRLWTLIDQTPALDWLLLSKRPENMRAMLPAAWLERPRHNVWLGATIEHQDYLDQRATALLSTPSVCHFFSCEPLKGPIDLRGYRPKWIIAGGESGAGAEPSHPDWFRSLRDQCQAKGIAFFFKQWGEWAPSSLGADIARASQVEVTVDIVSGKYGTLGAYEFDSPNTMNRVGKGAAGRILDGRVWDEFPQPVAMAY